MEFFQVLMLIGITVMAIGGIGIGFAGYRSHKLEDESKVTAIDEYTFIQKSTSISKLSSVCTYMLLLGILIMIVAASLR